MTHAPAERSLHTREVAGAAPASPTTSYHKIETLFEAKELWCAYVWVIDRLAAVQTENDRLREELASLRETDQ